MKTFLFLFSVLFAFQSFADCRATVDSVLSAEGLNKPGVKRKKIVSDAKKMEERREEYLNKEVYNNFGAQNGDDYEIILGDKKYFTEINEYANATEKVRVFDNKKANTIQGFSISKKNDTVVYEFEPDCSIKEVVMFKEGARCYLKKTECTDLAPLTVAKMHDKCSFYQNLNADTVNLFKKSCEIMSGGAADSTVKAAPGAAERKDKAPAVR